MKSKGKFAGLKKGDTVLIGDQYTAPFEAVVDHVNSIGQPYVYPTGARQPKYLFNEEVIVKGEPIPPHWKKK